MLGQLGQKCCCNSTEKIHELSFHAHTDIHQTKKVAPVSGDDEVCLSGVASARSLLLKRSEPVLSEANDMGRSTWSAPSPRRMPSYTDSRPRRMPSYTDSRLAYEDLQRELQQTQDALNRELEAAQLHTLGHANLSFHSSQAPNLPATNLVNSLFNSAREHAEGPAVDNSQIVLLPHDVGAMMLRCEPIDDPLVFLTIDIKSHARMEALVSRLAGLPPGGCVDFGLTLKGRQENQQIMFVRKHPLHNIRFGEVAGLFARKMTLLGLRTSEGIIGWAPPDSTRVNESDELVVVACTPYALAAGLTKESCLSGMPNGMHGMRIDDARKTHGSHADEAMSRNMAQQWYPEIKNRRCCS